MQSRRKKLPDILSGNELKNLFNQPNSRYPTGQRNYTILKITYDLGLRLSEIINLKWKHVNLNTGRVMIKNSKGAKDRPLFLPPEDIDLLREWRQRQSDEIGERTGCDYAVS